MTKTVKKSPGSKDSNGTVLRVLHDIVLIEEDQQEYNEAQSGLSKEVVGALKTGLLHTPDAYDSFAKKLPCRGTVIAKGPECKSSEIHIGSRVIYGSFGGERFKFNNRDLMRIREIDIHLVIA